MNYPNCSHEQSKLNINPGDFEPIGPQKYTGELRAKDLVYQPVEPIKEGLLVPIADATAPAPLVCNACGKKGRAGYTVATVQLDPTELFSMFACSNACEYGLKNDPSAEKFYRSEINTERSRLRKEAIKRMGKKK